MNRSLILIADDDRDIRDLLRILLSKEGYDVLEAEDGREAISQLERKRDDVSLVILDIMMPRMNGLEAASAIRRITDAPILFLTARSSDADKTAAYAEGGDDYITKPFHATDLLLKIRAMLKRYTLYRQSMDQAEANVPAPSGMFPGDVEWRPEEEAVYRMGERVVLTEREYRLFERLCRGRGENLSAATLYEDVWNEPYLASSSNTVIVHIANLRRKLEKDPSSPAIIRTVWGKGYRID